MCQYLYDFKHCSITCTCISLGENWTKTLINHLCMTFFPIKICPILWCQLNTGFLSVALHVCLLLQMSIIQQDVFMKHGCPRRQQFNECKISQVLHIELSLPKGHVFSYCITIQTLNIAHLGGWDRIIDRRTNRRTDYLMPGANLSVLT